MWRTAMEADCLKRPADNLMVIYDTAQMNDAIQTESYQMSPHEPADSILTTAN